MKKFIHESTRINCELLRAYRMFMKEDKIKLWLCDDANIDEDKFEIVIDSEIFKYDNKGSEIVKAEREKEIILNWIDQDQKSTVEIKFMQCSSRTQYCTEIHVLHKELDSEEKEEFYTQFWRDSLDTLRYYFNKDWIIKDADLTLTKLTGRVL